MSNKEFVEFKDAFGSVKQGFHSDRMNVLGLDVAKKDFIGTIILGLLIGSIACIILIYSMKLHNLSLKNMIIFWLVVLSFFVLVMFLFGIILHKMFSVPTSLNNFLFR